MIIFDNIKIGTRLKELRETRSLSQGKLAKELDKRIGMNSPNKIMVLDGTNGGQIVSALERGNRITHNVLIAYADVFEVSLDYLYCLTDEWQAGFQEIKDRLGLSNSSIAYLEVVRETWGISKLFIDTKSPIETINLLLEQAYKKELAFDTSGRLPNSVLHQLGEYLGHIRENNIKLEPFVVGDFDNGKNVQKQADYGYFANQFFSSGKDDKFLAIKKIILNDALANLKQEIDTKGESTK